MALDPQIQSDDLDAQTEEAMGLRGMAERTIGKKATGVADFVPIVGDVLAAGDVVESAKKGDVLGTAVNTAAMALGVVPVVGDLAGKGLKAGLKAVRAGKSPVRELFDKLPKKEKDELPTQPDEDSLWGYHGTARERGPDEPFFDIGFARKQDQFLGEGYYFTIDPKVAEEYANMRALDLGGSAKTARNIKGQEAIKLMNDPKATHVGSAFTTTPSKAMITVDQAGNYVTPSSIMGGTDIYGNPISKGQNIARFNLSNLEKPFLVKTAADRKRLKENFQEIKDEGYDSVLFADFKDRSKQIMVFPEHIAKVTGDVAKDVGEAIDDYVKRPLIKLDVGTLKAAGLDDAKINRWRNKNATSEEYRKKLKGRDEKLIGLAKGVEEGNITTAEYREAADVFRPIRKISDIQKPSSYKEVVSALDAGKRTKGVIGLNTSIPDGDNVTARLDINAYTDYDTWIPTLTHPELKTVYSPTVVLKDVTFIQPDSANVGKALKVATGKPKAPYAVMEGSFVNATDDSAFKKAKEVFDSDEWIQVGYDPTRRGFFYNRATGEPVLEASEVIQVGALVLAKNAKLGDAAAFAFNKGGIVPMKLQQQTQMSFMEEGGLQDDGANIDAVSGNEVPSGSMDQEVRDDIPARLSEGEYVVPADVVRYFGVKFFEDLRDEAKMGMGKMEQDGRIGGEPVGDPMEDELPFDISELQTVEEPVREMAEGGEVGPTFTYNPNTRYMQRQNTTTGFDMRVFINPATGRQITIPFFNGQPMSTIPEGFVLASDQAAAQQTAQQTTAQPEPYTERPSQGFTPSAPSPGFQAFTADDWNRWVDDQDSGLRTAAGFVPILGTLLNFSESSARKYAKKAIETGKHPSSGKDLTSEEITALTRVINMAERKSIFESVGDYLKGEPDQNMSPRPDYSKPSLDPYNEAAARLAQEQGADDMVETASSDTSTMSAIMAGVDSDKSAYPVGQQFASRTDVTTDADPMAAGVVNITDPLVGVLLDEASVSSLDDLKNSRSLKNQTRTHDGGPAVRTVNGETIYKAYLDTTGNWTVGPGIYLGAKNEVSEEAIQKDYSENIVKEEFLKRLNESASYIDNKYKPDTTPNYTPLARATLINMHFQLGTDRYETFTQLDRAILKGDYEEVAEQIVNNYVNADGQAVFSDEGKFVSNTKLYKQTPPRTLRHLERFKLVASQIKQEMDQTLPTEPSLSGAAYAGEGPEILSTPSFIEGMDAVPQAGAAPTTYVPPSGGTGVQDVAPPYRATGSGVQDVAPPVSPPTGTPQGTAGLLPQANVPTDMSDQYKTGAYFTPQGYSGYLPTSSDSLYGEGRSRDPQPSYRPTNTSPTPSGFAGPDFDPSSVDIDPSKTTKYFGGEPLLKAPQEDQAVSAPDTRDMILRQRSDNNLKTEGGFPPLGTTQAGPTVATMQGLQPPQVNTFDAPMIEPSASNLLKYEPLGQTQLPSSRRGGAGRFPNIAQPTISDSQLTLGSPITKAQMPQSLDTQTEQVFMPSYGTDEFEKARRSRPVTEDNGREDKVVARQEKNAVKKDVSSPPTNFKTHVVFGADSLAAGSTDMQRRHQHRGLEGIHGIAHTQYGSVQFHPFEKAGGGPSEPMATDLFRFRIDGEKQKFIRRYELEEMLGKKNLTTADIMAFDPTKWKRVLTGEKGWFGEDRWKWVSVDAGPKKNNQQSEASDDSSSKPSTSASKVNLDPKTAEKLGIKPKGQRESKAEKAARQKRIDKNVAAWKARQKKTVEKDSKEEKTAIGQATGKGYIGGSGFATGGLVKRRATKKKKKS